MQKKVEAYIARQRLFTKEDTVLVAVSGGADSVALLCLLLDLGYTCEAAHCNFHLRSSESDRDEEFVRQLCEKLNVKLHVTDFDTRAVAEERHISIEMAARELRYGWFEEVRQETGAVVIAVAHHQDDSAETLLLNLIRGTGINGLRGIRPHNGYIVRPLLCVERREILDYLNRIGQDYVTDSTNLQDEYTRNKIRLNLIPLMQEINPSVKKSLAETAEHLDDAAAIYNKGIEEAVQRVRTDEGINIPALRKEVAPETVLFEALHPLGFNAAQVKDIFRSLDGQAGKTFVSKEWRVVKDREEIIIAPLSYENYKSYKTYKSYNISPEEIKRSIVLFTTDFIIPHDKETACFDADKVKEPLTLRRWRQGDWFVPFGMRGKKLVSDYLTDRKLSRLEKEQQWVLCCGENIIWLVGERTDNRFRIDEKTRKVLVIRKQSLPLQR